MANPSILKLVRGLQDKITVATDHNEMTKLLGMCFEAAKVYPVEHAIVFGAEAAGANTNIPINATISGVKRKRSEPGAQGGAAANKAAASAPVPQPEAGGRAAGGPAADAHFPHAGRLIG